ncbi:MAG: site-specific integrase [Halapricum sp.]
MESDEFRTKNGEPYGGNSKRKFVNTLQKYSLWKAKEFDADEWAEYEPQETFGQSSYDSSDTFSLEEFGRLTEAAKCLNELPEDEEASPEERDEINARLAQRFHKPKSRVGADDWTHEENGAKIPSLVMTGQDLALPPIEIHRATVDWLNLERGVLDIPDEKASKQRESNELSLSQPTQEQLATWLDEREQYETYDDADALWLNERGNRYTSKTLNDLLEKLCNEAGIDQDGRKITWYSIRRTSGTYLKEYDSLEMAGDLLRHGGLDTTREHYSEVVREVQRTSVSGVRELGQARASGELSESEVAQILIVITVTIYRCDRTTPCGRPGTDLQ